MHSELDQDRVHVAVDVMVLTMIGGKLHLMLARRTHPPYKGLWALPGTLVGLEESAESAARRLMKEMLPVPDVYLEQLYTFSQVSRDPRGRVISVAYLAILPSGAIDEILAGGRTALQPFGLEAESRELLLSTQGGEYLYSGDLAFDHETIIQTGIARLQGKIGYTEIGFRFLRDPRCFSLSELQSVHEAVLGKPLDASNFRRTVLTQYERTGRISPTERTEKAGRGRPSVLYRMTD